MGRYLLQKSQRQEGWLVCTDTAHNIVCRFQEHRFNDTQEFTLLDGDKFKTSGEALAYATYMREMGDWLAKNHYNEIF